MCQYAALAYDDAATVVVRRLLARSVAQDYIESRRMFVVRLCDWYVVQLELRQVDRWYVIDPGGGVYGLRPLYGHKVCDWYVYMNADRTIGLIPRALWCEVVDAKHCVS